jgi:hypothetical protein
MVRPFPEGRLIRRLAASHLWMNEINVYVPKAIGKDRNECGQSVRALRHEGRLLPNVSLDPRGRYGAVCRARFDGRTLREAAEYVFECDTGRGENPDDFHSLLTGHTGTIGAKQALLAALAKEAGRDDVELVVACCELQLPEMAPLRNGSILRRPRTLPLAVCWLRHRGRRLQIVDPQHASLHSVDFVTEVTVPPEQLASERVRMYETFASDWCRALETDAGEFARLRASQLVKSADGSLFEDLMGYGLPAGYMPAV